MAIHYEGRCARFDGDATVEDALELAGWLRSEARATVDLAACTHMHTAVLQALLALGARVTAPPTDPFLARWVAPLLQTAPAEPKPRHRHARNAPEKQKPRS